MIWAIPIVASFLKKQMCDFLTTGETQYKTCIYDCVRTRARTLPAAAQGERIGNMARKKGEQQLKKQGCHRAW